MSDKIDWEFYGATSEGVLDLFTAEAPFPAGVTDDKQNKPTNDVENQRTNDGRLAMKEEEPVADDPVDKYLVDDYQPQNQETPEPILSLEEYREQLVQANTLPNTDDNVPQQAPGPPAPQHSFPGFSQGVQGQTLLQTFQIYSQDAQNPQGVLLSKYGMTYGQPGVAAGAIQHPAQNPAQNLGQNPAYNNYVMPNVMPFNGGIPASVHPFHRSFGNQPGYYQQGNYQPANPQGNFTNFTNNGNPMLNQGQQVYYNQGTGKYNIQTTYVTNFPKFIRLLHLFNIIILIL
jgi:hypothetical protein